jgi:hypothetical protein
MQLFTHVTKLIVTFSNFENASKNSKEQNLHSAEELSASNKFFCLRGKIVFNIINFNIIFAYVQIVQEAINICVKNITHKTVIPLSKKKQNF